MSSECGHSLGQSLYWGQPSPPPRGGRFLRFYGPAAGHWLIGPVFQLCLCAPLPRRKGSGLPTRTGEARAALAPGVMPDPTASRTTEKPEAHLGFESWRKEITGKTKQFSSWKRGPVTAARLVPCFWSLGCWVRGKTPIVMALDKLVRVKVSFTSRLPSHPRESPCGCP